MKLGNVTSHVTFAGGFFITNWTFAMWWFRRFQLANCFWQSGHCKLFFFIWSLAMWLVMILLRENSFSQTEQSPLWTLAMCSFNLLFRENTLSQTEHLFGLFPSCTLAMCSFKWPFWEDSLSQIEHLQCDDLEDFNWQTLFDKVDICKPFFSIWSLAMWLVMLLLRENSFSQTEQSPLWRLAMCSFNLLFRENISSQTEHLCGLFPSCTLAMCSSKWPF